MGEERRGGEHREGQNTTGMIDQEFYTARITGGWKNGSNCFVHLGF